MGGGEWKGRWGRRGLREVMVIVGWVGGEEGSRGGIRR